MFYVYHGLYRLAAASTGVYCGPLRLLALEIYERLTVRGISCSLLTGQQKIEPMFPTRITTYRSEKELEKY
jgi:ATP-dependent RNA helicase SUPV3L1/SUV3